MTVSPLYIPVLTGKQGEYAALRALAPDIRAAVRPILDIPPVAAATDPAAAIEKIVLGVGRSMGNEGHVAVDLLGLDDRLAGDVHPVECLIERAVWGGARVQLVVRTDASLGYRQAVARARSRAAGICVRARIQENDDPVAVGAQVSLLLGQLEVGPPDVHLILDAGRVSDWTRRPAEVLAEHLTAHDSLGDFRLRSAVATTVPPNKEIKRDDRPLRVQRREWRAWQGLASHEAARVHFGDYGITGPRPDTPPVGLPDPHLRYTTTRALLIWRGWRSERVTDEDEGDPTSFGDLCRELVDRDDFAGASFSPGDEVIAAVAARRRPNDGGSSQWVEWATSHHVTHVVKALQAGA